MKEILIYMRGWKVSLLFSDYAYSADGWHYIATFSFYKNNEEGYRRKEIVRAIASYEKRRKGNAAKDR